jgi:hypothetical protein
MFKFLNCKAKANLQQFIKPRLFKEGREGERKGRREGGREGGRKEDR